MDNGIIIYYSIVIVEVLIVVGYMFSSFCVNFCSESPKGANDASTFQRKVCIVTNNLANSSCEINALLIMQTYLSLISNTAL